MFIREELINISKTHLNTWIVFYLYILFIWWNTFESRALVYYSCELNIFNNNIKIIIRVQLTI